MNEHNNQTSYKIMEVREISCIRRRKFLSREDACRTMTWPGIPELDAHVPATPRVNHTRDLPDC